MPDRPDVVIVGAGHNGLVAAGYLARAGKRVLVLERRAAAGGIATTEEFAPGFRASAGPDLCGLLSPRLISDLRLTDHGLELLPLDPATTVLHPDGSHLSLWRDEPATLDAIGRRSRRDAERYPEFATLIQRIAGFLRRLAWQPPLQFETRSGHLRDQLAAGLTFRRLGGAVMHETLRTLPMPIADLLDDWFEDDLLKAVLAVQGVQGVSLGPRSAGSTALFLYHQLGDAAWPRVAWRLPRGGAGGFAAALARAAEANGADIRLGMAVERILVDGERVKGVRLESGEAIEAPTVLSSASPQTTFLELVEPGALDAEFLREILLIRARGVTAKLLLALDRVPEIPGLTDPQLHGVIQVGPDVDYIERAYDAVKYGQVSAAPVLEVLIPSLTDTGLAPDGRHVMSITAQYAPFHLRDSDWRDATAALESSIFAALTPYFPELESTIVARRLITPLDYAETYGLPEGSWHHVEPSLDQLYAMRPVAGWSRYRAPIAGLFLCGAGTHPGGGLSGASGHNAAQLLR